MSGNKREREGWRGGAGLRVKERERESKGWGGGGQTDWKGSQGKSRHAVKGCAKALLLVCVCALARV